MKIFNYALAFALLLMLVSCGNEPKQTEPIKETEIKKDSTVTDTLAKDESTTSFVPCTNDSMKELAMLISGKRFEGEAKYLGAYFKSSQFLSFAENFDKKWMAYDSSRLTLLKQFRDKEITPNAGVTKKLFYPFSGPDILYGYTFFPDADEYIMMGLEPIGTRPVYDNASSPDSMNPYYRKINESLLAILKYSFFRTKAMKTDLRNEELDGTMHLLILFLTRTGNSICSAKPIYIDSSGTVQYYRSFPELQKRSPLNKGIEIVFNSADNKTKKLYYYSLNLANDALKNNKGMMKYLQNMGTVNTYLKGASYLMHETYFGMVRDVILNQSEHVIQDDSGIAFRYFTKNGGWNYKFYGTYTRPISLFKYAYQSDLDSMYKAQGSTPVGFGIGYNFKDKNSNFMIATKVK